MAQPSNECQTFQMRQPLTTSEIVRNIVCMQAVGEYNSTAPKLVAPKRPDHRYSDYLQSPSISAQVISVYESHQNFTLNSTYNERSVVSYLHQCFEIVSVLGEGSFGNVYKVKDKKTHEMFAIKVSKIKYRNKRDRNEKLREVKWHGILPTHPNCVRLYNAWEQDANLYIQIELCIASLDMLVQYTLNNQKRFDEDSLWEMFFDILQGLQILHDLDFVHMDLKSANIFISADGVCKLGDFGLVLDLTNVSSSEDEGDSKYLAAEVLDGVYTKSADIFSLGIVILELASLLELPSSGQDWQDLRRGQLPVESKQHLSEEMRNVIIQMLNPKHSLRPSTTDLLNHPRFKYLKWKRAIQHTVHRVKKAIVPMAARICAGVHMLVDPFVKMYNVLSARYMLHPQITVKTPRSPRMDAYSDDEESYTAFASHFGHCKNVNGLPTSPPMASYSTPVFNTPSLSGRSIAMRHLDASLASSGPSVGSSVGTSSRTRSVRSCEGLRLLQRGKNLFQEFGD